MLFLDDGGIFIMHFYGVKRRVCVLWLCVVNTDTERVLCMRTIVCEKTIKKQAENGCCRGCAGAW